MRLHYGAMIPDQFLVEMRIHKIQETLNKESLSCI